MNIVDEMKRLLAERYGIRSSQELNRALASIGRIDIGVFASPIHTEGGIENEPCSKIA